MKLKYAIFVIILASSSARALTGNDWKAWCDTGESRALCETYVVGYLDSYFNLWPQGAMGAAMYTYKREHPQATYAEMSKVGGNMYDEIADRHWGPFCLPRGATRQQLQDVIYKYVNDHPESRHKDVADLFQNALHDAFPCNWHGDTK